MRAGAALFLVIAGCPAPTTHSPLARVHREIASARKAAKTPVSA